MLHLCCNPRLPCIPTASTCVAPSLHPLVQCRTLLKLKSSHIGRRQKYGSFLLLYKEVSTFYTIHPQKRLSSFCKLLYSFLLIKREVVILFSYSGYFSILPHEGFSHMKKVLPYKYFFQLFLFIILFSNYCHGYHFITMVSKPRFRTIGSLVKFYQKGYKSLRKKGFKWNHCDLSTFIETFLVYLTHTLTTILGYYSP